MTSTESVRTFTAFVQGYGHALGIDLMPITGGDSFQIFNATARTWSIEIGRNQGTTVEIVATLVGMLHEMPNWEKAAPLLAA